MSRLHHNGNVFRSKVSYGRQTSSFIPEGVGVFFKRIRTSTGDNGEFREPPSRWCGALLDHNRYRGAPKPDLGKPNACISQSLSKWAKEEKEDQLPYRLCASVRRCRRVRIRRSTLVDASIFGRNPSRLMNAAYVIPTTDLSPRYENKEWMGNPKEWQRMCALKSD